MCVCLVHAHAYTHAGIINRFQFAACFSLVGRFFLSVGLLFASLRLYSLSLLLLLLFEWFVRSFWCYAGV